jgi:iron complex outermembrane receptor protein
MGTKKRFRTRYFGLVVFAMTFIQGAWGQEAEEVIRLPGAEISADKETTQYITAEQMERRGDSDLMGAIRWVPGISLQLAGSRNETMFYLRGLDNRTIPVYLDGVPWGDPYGGQIDYSRFVTGDLESIEIDKGYSPLSAGGNNMGGVITMRTAKPKKPLELSLKTSWDFDRKGYAGNLQTFSAGAKQSLFYGKASFQWRGVDHWTLPESFVASDDLAPGAGGNPQKEGKRLWSDSRDIKVSALAGWTPTEAIDIWASYAYSDSDKRVSPPAVNGTDYSVWEWPYVTRHTVSLNGEWTPDRFFVKFLGFFDKFNNRLYPYPYFGGGFSGDAAYNAWVNGKSETSDYDDYTFGVNLQGGYDINASHAIAATVDFKEFGHKSFEETYYDRAKAVYIADGYQSMDVSEDLIFAGAEWTFKPIKPFTIKAGPGINVYIPGRMDQWDSSGTKTLTINEPEAKVAVTGQVGLFYDVSDEHELHLTWALKNRYPTLKEKFSSLGTGRNLPNPDLSVEAANHFELGYQGYFFGRINLSAAAFYSYVYDQITNVTVDPVARTTQYQNIDAVALYGFEAASELYLNEYLSLGAAAGLTKSDIKESAAGYTQLTNMPEFTANGYMTIKPFASLDTKHVENISIIPSFEYVGSRNLVSKPTVDRANYLSGYTLVNLKLSADITQYASIALGVNNLLDELYEITEYYPQAGRSFNITLTGRY